MSYRVKIILIFCGLFIAHLVKCVLYFEGQEADNVQESTGPKEISDHWISYLISVMYTLYLPLYIVFTWVIAIIAKNCNMFTIIKLNYYYFLSQAVQSKYIYLNSYIRSLISTREEPQLIHFYSFKTLFKQASKQVIAINKTFRLLMSFVFIVLTFNMIWDLLFIVLAFGFGFAREQPSAVRAAFWQLIGMIIKAGLIFYIIMQIIHVNDESKATVVFINDFVTQYKQELPPETYRSVSENSSQLSNLWHLIDFLNVFFLLL